MTPRPLAGVAVLLFLCATVALPAQNTARLSGVVVSAEDNPQPIRRAIVSLFDGANPLGRHVITDDEGRFSFGALRQGRYEVFASRQGFVTIGYGATRPGRPGAAITVDASEHVENIRLLLARGGVITGTVRDETGEPVRNIDVRVEMRGKERMLSLAQMANAPSMLAKTDDRGEYRVFALAAGTYIASARPLGGANSDLSAPSDADVDAMLKELQQRRAAGAGRAGQTGAATAAGVRNIASRPRGVDFATVFHPNAFTKDDAAGVTVKAGEVRSGVDITMRLMAVATVSGAISDLGGRPPTSVEITLTKSGAQSPASGAFRTVARADGTFRFSSVPPGRYLLAAAGISEAMRQAAFGRIPAQSTDPSSTSCAFAAQEVNVSGDDVTGVSLTFRSCLLVDGQVTFEASGPTPTALPNVRLTLQPDTSPGIPTFVPLRVPAAVGSDGRFTLGQYADVLPGVYHLNVEVPGSEAGRGWWLQSATADGRDILDVPLVFTTDSPSKTSVVLTLTDRHTSVSGILEAAPRSSPSDYSVIAFSTNRDWWRAPYRRIKMTRPTSKGEYLMHDLPPGEYYVAALTELAPDDIRDADFLDQIVPSAIRVTIGAAEAKVQNLRIR